MVQNSHTFTAYYHVLILPMVQLLHEDVPQQIKSPHNLSFLAQTPIFAKC